VLAVRVEDGVLRDEADVRRLCERFNAQYGETFGKGATFPQAGIVLNEIRLSAIRAVPKIGLAESTASDDLETARNGSRSAYWGPAVGFIETPVYDRDRLGANIVLAGPALCDAEDTVIVLPPGWRYRTDKFGLGWMERFDGSTGKN
jgi:N-methylhydantoinase A